MWRDGRRDGVLSIPGSACAADDSTVARTAGTARSCGAAAPAAVRASFAACEPGAIAAAVACAASCATAGSAAHAASKHAATGAASVVVAGLPLVGHHAQSLAVHTVGFPPSKGRRADPRIP